MEKFPGNSDPIGEALKPKQRGPLGPGTLEVNDLRVNDLRVNDLRVNDLRVNDLRVNDLGVNDLRVIQTCVLSAKNVVALLDALRYKITVYNHQVLCYSRVRRAL